ncbi:hypothetical protein QMT40_001519 [Parvibaculaceae bacterium PLY_AMNH_Bact1]|nr:hypothetical protein QMT40_001519 [Parvibaculaceae bacterium PLY_AMNH_Bact1]
MRSTARIGDPARLLLLSRPNEVWSTEVLAKALKTGMGLQTMDFDGFFSLPMAAQAGIVAFGIALVLLIIAQLLMATSLRNRSQSATLEGLRKDLKALAHSAGKGPMHRSSNGLAPPPRPVKRNRVRRQR